MSVYATSEMYELMKKCGTEILGMSRAEAVKKAKVENISPAAVVKAILGEVAYKTFIDPNVDGNRKSNLYAIAIQRKILFYDDAYSTSDKLFMLAVGVYSNPLVNQFHIAEQHRAFLAGDIAAANRHAKLASGVAPISTGHLGLLRR